MGLGELDERFFFCERTGDTKQAGGEFSGGLWTVVFEGWGRLTEVESSRQPESGDLKNVKFYSLKTPEIKDAVSRYGSAGEYGIGWLIIRVKDLGFLTLHTIAGEDHHYTFTGVATNGRKFDNSMLVSAPPLVVGSTFEQ